VDLIKNVRRGRGRPKKYGRASRAVTVTLPEDVLAKLTGVDTDLGNAIVTLAGRHGRPRAKRVSAAEITPYGKHAVIIVNPVAALKRLPGVQLVPIGGGRALISLAAEHSIPQLELAVRDAIDRRGVRELERQTLEAIAQILRQARLSRTVSLVQRTIIVIESKRQRRQGGPAGRARKVAHAPGGR
jgi:hypothetical protein